MIETFTEHQELQNDESTRVKHSLENVFHDVNPPKKRPHIPSGWKKGSQNDFLRPFFFWFFNFKKGVFYNRYKSNQDLKDHIGFWYWFYTSLIKRLN